MHFDEDVTDEVRLLRNKHIENRWAQLYQLSKESGDTAIQYLFTVNAGGCVAILTYMGTISSNDTIPSLSINFSLAFFFFGLLFVGIYKAYMIHFYENLFKNYREITTNYYNEKIEWVEKLRLDEEKIGDSFIPKLLGYLSFGFFIFGFIIGVNSFL